MSGEAAPVREPWVTRVAGALERLFNPILVKELRAGFRGGRFALVHIGILCVFGAALLIALASALNAYSGPNRISDPAKVGSMVFGITQTVLTIIVFLMMPGLAATSVTTERESQTLDLLLTTTMSARQVVWGKFMAAMVQALVVLVSMLPLIAICYLFGGISLGQILANYLFLALLSALLLANALAASSGAKSAQRAVGASYGLPVLCGIVGVPFLAALGRGDSLFFELMSAYGYASRASLPMWSGPVDPVDRIVFVYVIPAFLWAAALSFYFILATHRLMPIFSNRSTAMRIHATCFLIGGWAIAAWIFARELGTPGNRGDAPEIMAVAGIFLCIPALGLAIFSTEDPILPRHVAAAWDRRASILRMFGPGPDRGVALGVFLMALLAAATLTAGAEHGGPARMAGVAGVTLAWTWSVGAFGRFLVTVLGGRSGPARLLTVLGAIVLAVGPLIHWAIWLALERGSTAPDRTRGPLPILLSPVMAQLSLVDLDFRGDFPTHAGPLPVAPAFVVAATLAGAAFWILGTKARRVLERASAPPAPPRA